MSSAIIENGKHIYELSTVDLLTDDCEFVLSKDNFTRKVALKSLRRSFNGDNTTTETDNKYYSVYAIDGKLDTINQNISNISETVDENNVAATIAINRNTGNITLLQQEITRIDNETKQRIQDITNTLGDLGTIVTWDAVEADSGDTWGKAVVTYGTGITDIGKSLDFHAKDNDTDDYTVRLTATGDIDRVPTLTMSEATLVLPKNTSIANNAFNNPALVIGGTSAVKHIEVDSSTIQAKADASNSSELKLNPYTGLVSVGAGGLTVNGATTLNNTLKVADGKATTLGGTLLVKQSAQAAELTVNDDATIGGDTIIGKSASVGLNLSVSGNANTTGTLTVTGTTTLNNTLIVVDGKATTLGGALTVAGTTTLNNSLTANSASTFNGNLTVANDKVTTLGGTLEVKKAATLDSTLEVKDTALFDKAVTMKKSLSVDEGFTVTGATTLNNTLDVANGKATTLGGTLTVSGNSTLNGTATIAGATDIGGTLTVTGDSEFAHDLTVDNFLYAGAADITYVLSCGSDFTCSASATISNNLTVNGNITGKKNIEITGGTGTNIIAGKTKINNVLHVGYHTTSDMSYTLNVYGTSYITGNTTVAGTFTVGAVGALKNTTLNGNLTVSGSTSISGSLTALNGATIAGNALVSGILNVTGGTSSENVSTFYGPLKTNKSMTVVGNLSVGKNTGTSANTAVVNVYGQINVSKNVSVSGDLTADTITASTARKIKIAGREINDTLSNEIDLGITYGKTVPETLEAGHIFLQYFD